MHPLFCLTKKVGFTWTQIRPTGNDINDQIEAESIYIKHLMDFCQKTKMVYNVNMVNVGDINSPNDTILEIINKISNIVPKTNTIIVSNDVLRLIVSQSGIRGLEFTRYADDHTPNIRLVGKLGDKNVYLFPNPKLEIPVFVGYVPTNEEDRQVCYYAKNIGWSQQAAHDFSSFRFLKKASSKRQKKQIVV